MRTSQLIADSSSRHSQVDKQVKKLPRSGRRRKRKSTRGGVRWSRRGRTSRGLSKKRSHSRKKTSKADEDDESMESDESD